MSGVMGNIRGVNFHGIGTPKRVLDPGEAPYWISIDRFRYMLDQIAAHPDRSRIAITFDDGNLSDLEIGVPELLARRLDAEFFVLTGRLAVPGALSVDDTRALLAAGMRIGSHGIDHRDWSSLSADALWTELTASRQMLEEVCGKPVRSAAIPFGRYNAAVISTARKAGYEALYSSDWGTSNPQAYLRPRSTVRSDTTDATFQAILDGRMPIAMRLRRAASMTLKRLI